MNFSKQVRGRDIAGTAFLEIDRQARRVFHCAPIPPQTTLTLTSLKATTVGSHKGRGNPIDSPPLRGGDEGEGMKGRVKETGHWQAVCRTVWNGR